MTTLRRGKKEASLRATRITVLLLPVIVETLDKVSIAVA
jgi:hypothetical protein